MKPGDVIQGYRLIERLDQGGSDRKFFRCEKENATYILVHDNELEYYLKLHKHLSARNIGVPEIYWHSLDHRLMVQEDIGDDSLFALYNTEKDSLGLYQMTLEELIKLQIDARPGAPVRYYYDQEHIRWEQEYFRDHFLLQYCGFKEQDMKGLEDDFTKITTRLLETAAPMSDYLMHRDFQSQNIYFKDHQIRIIDFQAARIGPLTYDLAALLRDAYITIDIETENLLIEYYYSCIRKRGILIDRKRFFAAYELTCLQRNMQALGAFANLSLNKRKPHFAQHIPRGVVLLQRGVAGKDFTQLRAIVLSIKP